MSRTVALGRRHFVGIFAAAGARPVRCESPEAFDEAVNGLLAEDTPDLVFLDQAFADREERIQALREEGGAAVLLLPAEPPEGHPALDQMRSLIELAAGANILGEY
ncbi:MAG: V-type ATP synthase subunit F [Planctomycetota bacterium]